MVLGLFCFSEGWQEWMSVWPLRIQPTRVVLRALNQKVLKGVSNNADKDIPLLSDLL